MALRLVVVGGNAPETSKCRSARGCLNPADNHARIKLMSVSDRELISGASKTGTFLPQPYRDVFTGGPEISSRSLALTLCQVAASPGRSPSRSVAAEIPSSPSAQQFRASRDLPDVVPRILHHGPSVAVGHER